MDINEMMPNFILKKIKKIKNIKNKRIGVLGVAFKAETDDIRDSLAIKLIKLLKNSGLKVLQSDEYHLSKNNIKKEKSPIVPDKTVALLYQDPNYAYSEGLDQFGWDVSIICQCHYIPADKLGITKERT